MSDRIYFNPRNNGLNERLTELANRLGCARNTVLCALVDAAASRARVERRPDVDSRQTSFDDVGR